VQGVEPVLRAGVQPAVLVGEQQDAHDDEDEPADRRQHQVVVAHPAKRGRRAVERHRAQQERDRQAHRVAQQQHAAVVDGVLVGRGGEDRAEGGPGARRPRDRERQAGDDGAAAARAAHQRLGPPLLVQRRDERRQHEEHAQRDDERAADAVQRQAVVGQRAAELRRAHAEQDEHHGEAQAEDHAGDQQLREAALAGPDLGQADARDRAQIPRHEREHARRHE